LHFTTIYAYVNDSLLLNLLSSNYVLLLTYQLSSLFPLDVEALLEEFLLLGNVYNMLLHLHDGLLRVCVSIVRDNLN
jgi:hypothetical protein